MLFLVNCALGCTVVFRAGDDDHSREGDGE